MDFFVDFDLVFLVLDFLFPLFFWVVSVVAVAPFLSLLCTALFPLFVFRASSKSFSSSFHTPYSTFSVNRYVSVAEESTSGFWFFGFCCCPFDLLFFTSFYCSPNSFDLLCLGFLVILAPFSCLSVFLGERNKTAKESKEDLPEKKNNKKKTKEVDPKDPSDLIKEKPLPMVLIRDSHSKEKKKQAFMAKAVINISKETQEII